MTDAGPSRSSSRPVFESPPPLMVDTDVLMADIIPPSVDRTTNQGDADEAAQLLLSVSALVDQRVQSTIPAPQTGQQAITDVPHTSPRPNPSEKSFVPHTPPDDSQIPLLPHNSATTTPAVLAQASIKPHRRSNATEGVRTKVKQRRNAQAGPSRRTSNDGRSSDRERPPHWMGYDNTVIRCICGVPEDDGFTIQCEGCGAWEHGQCFGYWSEASAPETYFCELCISGHYDFVGARQKQNVGRMELDSRSMAALNGQILPEKDKIIKPRSKPKRTRTGSVMDGEEDEAISTFMGPPPVTKSKKKTVTNKHRLKQSNGDNITGSTSTPTHAVKDSLPPLQTEEEYYGIEPWTYEYTPIEENVVRGKMARQIMASVYREWVDAEEEVVNDLKRHPDNPSGLPSPAETGDLRFSPDSIFAKPNFAILAPPVPPVFLTGLDLDSLAPPASVRTIPDSSSFLPLDYVEPSSFGIYNRPSLYGVFADDKIQSGSFIGEYRGEILDCQSYRRDPINQYPGLGLPKPYVRSLGPPINLMIDARGYGCRLRFIRSGCHPNVVIRPIFWRSSESVSPKLRFGVFASRDVKMDEEIVLGWEWDDQHVVHSLHSAIIATINSEGSLGAPQYVAGAAVINAIASKFQAVLTYLSGTFTGCSCRDMANCAISQMRHICEGKEIDLEEGCGRADLGELVGAVRGWRRREIEAVAARHWVLPDVVEIRVPYPHSPGPEPKGDELMPDPPIESPSPQHSPDQDDFVTWPSGLRRSSQDSDGRDEERVDMIDEAALNVQLRTRRDSWSPSSSPFVDMIQPRPVMTYEDMDIDDGSTSEVTTITVPKSQSSISSDLQGVLPNPLQNGSSRHNGSPSSDLKRPTSIIGEKESQSQSRIERVKSNIEVNEKPERHETSLVTSAKITHKGSFSTSAISRRPRKRIVSSSPAPRVEDSPRSATSSLSSASSYDAPNLRPSPREQISSSTTDATSPVVALGNTSIEHSTPAREASAEREASSAEAVPPPKEPTPPPPEPPKKVSLSEYLKNHKIRKESLATPSQSTITENPPVETPFEEIISLSPGLTPQVNSGSETPSTRVNLFEHLPSSRNSALTVQTTPTANPASPGNDIARPPINASLSYTQRSEYFPSQPSAYAPRISASYTPRQMSVSLTPLTPDSDLPGSNPQYRDSSDNTISHFIRPNVEIRTALPLLEVEDRPMTPPQAETSIPPALPFREPPPHQSQAMTVTARVPPTGPKMPPTGPRGTWNSPVPPLAQASNGLGLRGGFSSVLTRGHAATGIRGGFGSGAGLSAERGGLNTSLAVKNLAPVGFGDRGGSVERGGFFRGRGIFRGKGRGG